MKFIDSNVTLMVSDLNASVKFYQQLGLELRQQWGEHYAMLQAGGLTIGLHPGAEKGNNSGTSSVGFMVDDITEPRTVLESLKVEFEYAEGKSGQHLNFSDPDGNLLYYLKPGY